MAEYSEPHDGGALMYEESWTELWDTVSVSGIPSYAPTSLEVYTNGDGRQIRIRPGVAFVKGHRYRNDAAIVFNLPANTTGATRHDTLLVRFSRPEGRVGVGLVLGLNGGGLPGFAVTNDVYDMMLARVSVPNGFTTITSAMISDLRPIAGAKTVFPKLTWRRPGVAGAPGYQNSYADWADGANEDVRYSKDSMGVVRIEGMARKGTGSAIAFTLPAGFRPIKNRNYVGLHGPAGSSGSACTVVVAADGRVIPYSSGTGWVSFSGIQFESEQ